MAPLSAAFPELPPWCAFALSTSRRPLQRLSGKHAAFSFVAKSDVAYRLLSWGFQSSPLHRHRPASPLPVARGPGLPHPVHVPSLLFLPATTVYSSLTFVGLLHPTAGHGVRSVSSRPTTASRSCSRGPTLLTSARPFEAFPSFTSGAMSIHRGGVTTGLPSAPSARSVAKAFRLTSTSRE